MDRMVDSSTTHRLQQVNGHLSTSRPFSMSSLQAAAISSGSKTANADPPKKRIGGGDGGDEPKVLTRQEGSSVAIILNRPKALNALDSEMVELIGEAVHSTPPHTHIVLRGVGRALCSGGDVMAVVTAAASVDPKVRQQALDFFKNEFQLDYKIATLHKGKFPRAFVSVMDGITMGGGVGLSLHAPIRIATEKTLFAMPETGIGYFPDVGVTRCLSRLDGKVGHYLGLTGARISGEEAYIAGLATHFISSSNIDSALHRLTSLPPNAPAEQIANILDEFSVDPFNPDANPKGSNVKEKTPLFGTRRMAIDYVFGQPSAEAVFSALGELASGSPDSQAAEELKTLGVSEIDESILSWANETLETVKTKSPRSIKISLTAINEARRFDVEEAFRFDMRLATAFCDLGIGRDFHTGVLHTLTKDPQTGKRREGIAPWDPPSIDRVNDEAIRNQFFGSISKAKAAGLSVEVPELDNVPHTGEQMDRAARQKHEEELKGLGPLHWEKGHNAYALPSEAECAALVEGSHPASGSTALEADELIGTLRNVKGQRPALDLKISEWLERAQRRAKARSGKN